MTAEFSLPMYDWPELRSATDEFWNVFAKHAGIRHPLAHGGPYDDAWCNPTMVFSQTCGYPFTHEFKGQLNYVATPHYACPGCDGANYSSFIFARNRHLENATPAINSLDSMSGMLALKLVFPKLPAPVLTGSHVASLQAVQSGLADICAIDAVVLALARRHRPHLLEGLIKIAQTPIVPGLPFVTKAGDVNKLQAALAKTFADPAAAEARSAMLLSGFSILPPGAYDVIPQLESTL